MLVLQTWKVFKTFQDSCLSKISFFNRHGKFPPYQTWKVLKTFQVSLTTK